MNIILTGASRGIGYEILKKFYHLPDAKIIALSRNTLSLESFDNQEQLRYLNFDVGNLHNISELLQLTETFLHHKVDILINNAGLLINKPFKDYTIRDFDQIFDVNVKGVFFLIQQLLPYFNQPAHIVNIGSMGGFQGSVKFPGLSLYSASKGALGILTECLAEELKPQSISVNTLALGAVATDMLQSAFPGFRATVSAADMAAYIVDFALNGHKFFNGKILPVANSTP